MTRLEILAPAGGEQSLFSAVRSGADAVYLGASRFSARSSAHNFNKEQLADAVRYCHINGTALHLACNTLVHDDEISSAMELIGYACSIGVDALIMQDPGLISLVRRAAPDMPIHGSTQMSVHTLKGVEYLAGLGLTRAVLSRELSADEIREIVKASPIEIEVFVHGALCMSVSGQCYFSAMLGSRSGNRGACAQPCRLPFSVRGGTGHDLSLKDLSVIDHLKELEEMGVASAKIEGRMKRPEYVAAAVTACRESLDNGEMSPETRDRLMSVFSRSGFTDGYYTGRIGREMFGVRSKDNVEAADSKVFARIHELYKNERRHIPVQLHIEIKKDKRLSLSAEDDRGNRAFAEGSVPEKAVKVGTDRQRCEKSLSKTGGTPYIIDKLECDIDEGLSVPASALNELRSSCLSQLSEKRGAVRPVGYEAPAFIHGGAAKQNLPQSYRALFRDDTISDSFLDCELIYVPCTLSDKKLEKLMDRGFAVAVDVPRGLFGIEKSVFRRLGEIQKLGINEVLANNVAVIQMAQELGMDIHGGFGLNLTNTQSMLWAQQQGMLDAEVSFELTLEQISRLGGKMPAGIISYGRLPLMLTRNCPAKNDGKGCKHCKKAPLLRDRKGMDFPMKCFGSCTEILNSVPLYMADRRSELRGVSFEVLRFSCESREEREQIFNDFRTGASPRSAHTRGLYYRGVE